MWPLYSSVYNVQLLLSFSLAKLERLTMTDNKLEALPPEFGQLSNLIQLNLSRNHLSWLPGELYSCRELTRLYVARNRIKVLPEVSHLLFSSPIVRKNKCCIPDTMPSTTGYQGISKAEDSRRCWK